MTELLSFLSETQAVLLMAFIGGFVDAAGYLKLQGVFTSSITGNLVVACASVSSSKGVICRSCVCIAFTLAGFVSTLFSLRLKLYSKWRAAVVSFGLYTFEFLLLVCCIILGLIYDDIIENTDTLDNGYIVLVASIMGAAMGVHNVATKETINNSPPTTVMTSTLINFSQQGASAVVYYLAAFDLFCPSPTSETALKQNSAKAFDFYAKFIITSKPLFFFLVGAIVGAVTMYYTSFWCIIIPSTGVAVVLLDIFVTTLSPPPLPDHSKESPAATAPSAVLRPSESGEKPAHAEDTAAGGDAIRKEAMTRV